MVISQPADETSLTTGFLQNRLHTADGISTVLGLRRTEAQQPFPFKQPVILEKRYHSPENHDINSFACFEPQ
jgi:hypothetical protein